MQLKPPFPYVLPVRLPEDAVILDLSRLPEGPAPLWSIGRYDEDRVIYTQALFAGAAPRTIHMGIDLGGPVGTPVYAVGEGRVLFAGFNPEPGDYGHVLVLEHALEGRPIYALYGHLSADSLALSPPGRSVRANDRLGSLGDVHENGGWPPHLHFQLAWECPETHDMPGAVSHLDRAEARLRYPDPARMLGGML
jgi:murein DD-endopeptidase MepM/ murein hydrolase activator NlpD